jgi:hypothetical protein
MRPDPQRWEPRAHRLGRSELRPRNVAFESTGVTLALPAGTTEGAEIRGTERRGDGAHTARMRSAGSPGSISAFFLYRHDAGTDTSDELDFEILGGEPHRMLTTVWRRGVREPVAQAEEPLEFAPAAESHDYSIRRAGAEVTFLLDGEEVFFYGDAPAVALRPYFNAWYPTWRKPAAPPAGGEMRVESYEFAPPAAL